MERAWSILAVLCLIAAALLLWRDHLDAAFVVAALGAVAWFLGYRDRLRKTIVQPSEATERVSSDSEDQDEN